MKGLKVDMRETRKICEVCSKLSIQVANRVVFKILSNFYDGAFQRKYRNSRQEVFCKNGGLGNCVKFTGGCGIGEIWKISKNNFSYKTSPVTASGNS